MSLFDSVLAATAQQSNSFDNTVVTPQPSLVVDNTAPVLDAKVTQDYTGQHQELFKVVETPLESPEYGTIPGKKALFVDGENVNIVSDKYEVHQPTEIVEQFKKLGEQSGFEFNRVVTNPHKGALLLSGSFPGCKIVGEPHDTNITLYTSHCGMYRTIVTLDLLRIACMNQVPTIYRNKQRHIISEKHYKNALDIKLIGDKLAEIPRMVEDYNEKANRLKDARLSFNDFVSLWIDHYKVSEESKRFDSKIEALRKSYYNVPGQRELESNAYKAFQCVTYNNTHESRNTKHQLETIHHKNSNDSLQFLEVLLEEVAA